MPQLLASVFGELGITQYLNAFIDQGFDTWDTILDITESDLDALGVKLGHRRKLQRRIANSRGIAADASLVSPTQPSIEELRLQDQQRNDAPRLDTRDQGVVVVAKRKYRRHPKPDENAPERPPSAYVLFSNKMREELKGRNLSFTEIAKLVGENWQNLTPAEKEPFESQAQSIKEKYLADLAEYKKTADYKKYMAYLQEFKAKHSSPSQDKDGSKRVKISESGSQRRASPSTAVNRSSRSGSGTESRRSSEPPTGRQQRMGSTVSVSPSQASQDEAIHSPIAPSIEHHSSDRSPIFNSNPREIRPMPSQHQQRSPAWGEEKRPEQPLLSLAKETYEVKKGDWVLLHAAAGGAGFLMTQLLKHLGAHVIGTAGGPEKVELVKSLGADHVIDYRSEEGKDWVKTVLEITGGRGVDVVYDSVGKDTWEGSLAVVKRKGTVVWFGNSSGPVPPIALNLLSPKCIKIARPQLFGYIVTREEFESYANELFELLTSGVLKVRVHGLYPLDKVQQAHIDLEGRKTTGKLLIKL